MCGDVSVGIGFYGLFFFGFYMCYLDFSVFTGGRRFTKGLVIALYDTFVVILGL